MNILDVGCGNAKAAGAVGIDFNPATQADIIHDLNQFPWPLAENQFDRVICSHIVEHVADMMAFMEEIHRVSRPGGLIEIVTPHFSNRFSYTDPTHLRHLSLRSFDYFMARRTLPLNLVTRFFETQYAVPDFYLQPLFRRRQARLSFARPFRLLGIDRLANRYSDFYEFYLAFLFPGRDIYLTLEVLKS